MSVLHATTSKPLVSRPNKSKNAYQSIEYEFLAFRHESHCVKQSHLLERADKDEHASCFFLRLEDVVTEFLHGSHRMLRLEVPRVDAPRRAAGSAERSAKRSPWASGAAAVAWKRSARETQGTFVAELQRVTWTLSSSSPTSAVDGDGATDESISLWATVTVVHKNGQLLDKVWFAGGDDNTLAKSFHLPSQHAVDSARGDAGETDDEMTVQLQYHQCSKALPLTKDMLETLLDELLGEQQLSLMNAIMSHSFQEKVRIPTRAIVHELVIDVCIQVDVDLADFASGCRVLRIHSLALVNLPKEWTLPCANDDEAIQMCAAPERNLATYDLEIRLPDLATSEPAVPTESFVLSGGKLQYEPSGAITVPPAAADNEDTSGDPSASAPQLTGAWSVALPPTAAITKLFLKTAVDRLAEFIHVDKHIGATLRRTYVEGAAKLPEVLTANVRIHLSDLVRPGTARMLARVKVNKRQECETSHDSLKRKLETLDGHTVAAVLKAYVDCFLSQTDAIPLTPSDTRGVYLLFFDGGSRGNPGPGGTGSVIVRVHKDSHTASLIWVASMAYSRKDTTNNFAEYWGLIHGLREVQRTNASVPSTAPIGTFIQTSRRLADCIDIRGWYHHYRAFNKMADSAANLAMDTRTSTQVHFPTHRAAFNNLTQDLDNDVMHWLMRSSEDPRSLDNTRQPHIGPREHAILIKIPVAKESIEQDLAAAVSNDEKKKIQAALADYESVVHQAASISNALSISGTYVESIIEVLSSPLVLQPPSTPLPPSLSIGEVIPQRDLVEEREQRIDSIAGLHTEIRRIVVTLLHEYEDSFHGAKNASIDHGSISHLNNNARGDKKQKLIFKLNTQGVYQNFKETLKKRIIPVIRDRFARSELISDDDADGLDEEEREHPNGTRHKKQGSKANERKKEYFGRVYALVMEEVHTVLHEAIYSDLDALEKASASMQDKPSEKEMAAVLDALKLKAMENEVNGDAEKSEVIHLDRIAYAEEHALLSRDDHNQHHQAHHQSTAHPSPYALESVWYDYARFSLIQGDMERAGTSFRQCLSLNARSLPALIGYTALLCELRDSVHVEHFGKSTIALALAAYSASTFTGVTKTIWTDVVLAHALLAFYFVQSGKDPTGNLALFELLKAQQILQHDGGETCKNACLASVWIFLVEYTNELKLRETTQLGLELADSFRKPRDVLSAQERVVKRAIEAESRLAAGDSDRAIKLLRDALEIEPSHPFAWLILGKAYLQQKENQTETAIECLQRALENHTLLRTDELRLGLYVHLGIVLLQASQFGLAETVFLQACDEFRVASNWLGVGIASLRMEKWELAHMAFAEANRLDVSNLDVWGYLALFALTSSHKITARQETEAKRFVQQALRYNLSNPVLLRELSNGFVAIDRLEDAEKLLRRSLVCQDSSLTRKTLADVLAAQNCAEDALRQYKRTLDASDDVRERCGLLEECAKLLTTLGRPDEASEYRKMANQFQIETDANNGADPN
ncbi:Tetratricopeptide repeat-containing domain, partial [Globisporangium splendens]